MSKNKTSVLVSGATGFIGQHFCRHLKQSLTPKYEIIGISRKAQRNANHVDRWLTYSDLENYENKDLQYGINCAGINVFRQRWNDQFYQDMIQSRLEPGKQIYQCLQSNVSRDGSMEKAQQGKMLMMSGISYYFNKWDEKAKYLIPGNRGINRAFTENDMFDEGTTKGQQMAIELESSLHEVEDVPIVYMRPGLVCDRSQGALPFIQASYLFTGFGGYCKPGLQMMNYIHIKDLVRMMKLGMEDPKIQGPLNAVAPDCDETHQMYWYKDLAKLTKRFRLLVRGVRPSVMRLVLGDGRYELACEGVSVIPEKAIEHGFQFEYPNYISCLSDCSHGKGSLRSLPGELSTLLKLRKKLFDAKDDDTTIIMGMKMKKPNK